MIKRLVRRIEVLGYKVNCRKQLENISALVVSILVLASFIAYLEYMPVMVSALILTP